MYYSEFVQHLEEIISEKSIHNKVRKLCETLTQIEPYEIAPVIYLLQGRLAETYIDREHGYGFQRRVADSYRLLQASHIAQSNENIISNLTRKIQQVEISTKKVFVGPDLYSFYTQLHNNVSDLDAWLTFKRQIPSWLIELSDGMNNQEVKLLGYLLRGPLLKDELIIRAIAQLGKGGRGSQQVIMQAYKHCISDL